jgi:hypothetical protein
MTLRGFFITLGISVATAAFGFIPLMGLPGAIAYLMGLPVAILVYGSQTIQKISTDAFWPTAIYMTFLWPISFVVGYMLGWGVFGGRVLFVKWAVLVGTALLWAVILTLIFVRLAPKQP